MAGDYKVNIILGARDDASRTVKGLRGQFQKFKQDAVTGFGLGAGISVFNMGKQALGSVVDVMGDALGAASDLVESQGKVDEVFGDSADVVHSWADELDSSYGLTKQAALESAGTFGNFTKALGLADDEALDVSTTLTTLAGDLASFNNMDVSDVLVSLRSGLAGEAEPMRRLGSDISVARVNTLLLAKGVEKVNGKYTEAEKVVGRYEAIMQDTVLAQGDAERTSDTLAGKQRQLDAVMGDLSATLGGMVIGPATDFLGFLVDVLDMTPDVSDRVKIIGERVAKLREEMEDGAEAAGLLMDEWEPLTELDVPAWARSGMYYKLGEELLEYANKSRLTREELRAMLLLYEDYPDGLSDVLQALKDQYNAYDPLSSIVTETSDAVDENTDAFRGNADILGTASGWLVDMASRFEDVAGKVGVLSDAIDHVADVSFEDVKQESKAVRDAIKDAFSDPIPTIKKLRQEERVLAAQRRRAMREGRFDIVAMIDKRREAIGEQITQRQTVNKHYKAEKTESKARKRHIKAIKEETGKSHAKAVKLYELFGKDWKIHLDAKEARARIAEVKADLIALTSSQVYVDFRDAERRGAGGPRKTGGGGAGGGGTNNVRTHTGGVVAPGETAVIRQNEAVLTPSSRTQIVPLDGPGAPRGGGGNVYLDGHLVGKVMDEHMGRQYGTASRVSNYRRSA